LANTLGVNFEPIPLELRSYGQHCGEIVADIFIRFSRQGLDGKGVESHKQSLPLYYKDFNTNKHFSSFIKNDDDKMLFLYILHILSFVNFPVKLLRNFEKDDLGWWLRNYYVTYHYAKRRMIDIKNHLDNNKVRLHRLYQVIDRYLSNCDESLTNSQFRNCMMHYDLCDKNGVFLISQEHQDDSVPLFGLVESCFKGVSYAQLKANALYELNVISDVLSDWVSIPAGNKIKF